MQHFLGIYWKLAHLYFFVKWVKIAILKQKNRYLCSPDLRLARLFGKFTTNIARKSESM